MASPHPMLKPYTPDDGPWEDVQAAHLLNRAGFGGTDQEVAFVRSLGPQDAVDWLLDFPDAPAEEQSQTDLPDLSSIEGYPSSFREYRRMLATRSKEEQQQLQNMLQAANTAALQATGTWWMDRMAYGPHPLQEKLTLLWHGHFTTSARDERSALLMWKQNELLRRMAVGNFREFVQRISRDPAMLDYLNNTQNRKQSPNENYARELMELFTLGIGNYGEKDIKEAARAFTGWTHDGDEFVFRRNEHDNDAKTFFGRSGDLNGDDIIELILARRTAADYVAARLFAWLAGDPTDPALAAALGESLYVGRYEMRPLVRTILTSKAFYQPERIGGQVKSPVQLVVGTVRVLGMQMPDAQTLAGPLRLMGQVPFLPPNVKGWPGGRTWINTATLFARYNTAVQLAGGGEPANNNRRKPARGKPIVSVIPDLDVAGATPDQLVDMWVARLIQRPIAPDRRQTLVQVLNNKNGPEDTRRLIQMIVSMPEYQLC